MKKSTKSEKPAAPQVKSVVPKPVEPKPVKKAAAPRKKPAPVAPAAAAPAPAAPAAKAVAPKAPAAKPAAPVRKSTTVSARIDIGFGNTLFIRGEGPGLSWDRGVALNCLADDLWSITLPGSANGVIFKFLVNDLSWSAGSDFVVASGDSVELTPTF